jgi:hypothetical protein
MTLGEFLEYLNNLPPYMRGYPILVEVEDDSGYLDPKEILEVVQAKDCGTEILLIRPDK